MKFLLNNILSFVCLVAMCAVGLVMYPGLPESLPTQYDLNGAPSNYLSKQAVILIMPLAYAASIAAINFMVRYSPDKFSMQNSQRAMDIIIFGVGILLFSLHLGIMTSLGDSTIFQRYFSIGFASFLIVTGNVFGKTERNFIIGIRIPWTLASKENWRATHRFAGRLMVISGVLLLFISLYTASLWTTLGLGLSWLVVSAVYSFLFFLKNERTS